MRIANVALKIDALLYLARVRYSVARVCRGVGYRLHQSRVLFIKCPLLLSLTMQTSSFARYFSGEARIWPRNFSRLWKAYHLLPPAAAVRIVELATSHLWRWDSLRFRREHSYYLQEMSRNNIRVLAWTPPTISARVP